MRSEDSNEIKELLLLMSNKTYASSYCDCRDAAHVILDHVASLLKIDYNIIEVNGRYTDNYPCRIIIPESSKHDCRDKVDEFDINSFKESVADAQFARCRKRFPAPVILFQGKFICRSSTIATGAELYYRMTKQSASNLINNVISSYPSEDVVDDVAQPKVTTNIALDNAEPVDDNNEFPELSPELEEKDLWRVSSNRSADIRLLKTLHVGTIVDLMVEKKKIKFIFSVSSSEKVDALNRYSDFKIISLPYPGCEFFAEYKRTNYAPNGLHFDWNSLPEQLNIDLPSDYLNLNIQWNEYKDWDLLTLTQNYFKLLLNNLSKCDKNGILIHCISGWDRTPLFISLLRLSLWADGLIHKSLDEYQMLYLTLAYDWYLFGHNLPDRLAKGEVILFFCFNVLKYLEDKHFSMLPLSNQNPSANATNTYPIASYSSEFDDREMDYFIHDDCSNETVNGNDFLHNQDSNSSGSVITDNGHPGSINSETCPVAVPQTGRTRTKTDSTSSGSWQMVSQCGSLRSPEPPVLGERYSNKNTNSSTIDSELERLYKKRKERLDRIRAVFLHCYCTTFDINHIPGTFENIFADMIGLNRN